jgi:hypothetical protein
MVANGPEVQGGIKRILWGQITRIAILSMIVVLLSPGFNLASVIVQ